MNVYNKRIALVNMTCFIPQRVLLIAKVLGESNKIVYLCWDRHRQGEINIDTSIKIRAKSYLSFIFILLWKLIRLDLDCLVFDDFRLFPLVVPLCRLKKVKILYNMQEVPIVTAAEKICSTTKGFFPFLLALELMKRLEGMFLKSVDGILTIPLNNSEMKRIVLYNKNLAVIENSPDITVEPHFFEIQELEGKRYIVYAGNISEKMGLTQYLRLLRQLREVAKENIYLLLIGHLWETTEDDLRNKIVQNKVEGYVIYKPWIPYEKLLSLIAKAEIGLALFDPEYKKFKYMAVGGSRKIFTYMWQGIPVISNLPLGAVVSEENCGINVKFGDEQELYKVTLSLLRNENMRQTMGENGKKAILLKYNLQLNSEKIRNVFYKMWL